MAFCIPKPELRRFAEKVAHVNASLNMASPECPGGRCGNNCSGTCAWSPCTNSYAATH